MKSIILFLSLLYGVISFSKTQTVHYGDTVFEIEGSAYSLQTIQGVLKDNSYLLSDGRKYLRNQFLALVHEYAEIYVGDKIFVIPEMYIVKVESISEKGHFILSNNTYATPEHVLRFVYEYAGIQVGDKVFVKPSKYIATVESISEKGHFILSNNVYAMSDSLIKIDVP